MPRVLARLRHTLGLLRHLACVVPLRSSSAVVHVGMVSSECVLWASAQLPHYGASQAHARLARLRHTLASGGCFFCS